MQTLWSRARSATNSCRCSLCNPPRTTVPRRTGGAAPTRRRHGVGDVFTIFYGTVIAAALFTDAATKIGSRTRLDRALDTVKKENEALDRKNRERLGRLGINWEEGGEINVGVESTGAVDQVKSSGETDMEHVDATKREAVEHRTLHRSSENLRRVEAQRGQSNIESNSAEALREDEVERHSKRIDGIASGVVYQKAVEEPLKVRRVKGDWARLHELRLRISSLGPDDRAMAEEWIAGARSVNEKKSLQIRLTRLLHERHDGVEVQQDGEPTALKARSVRFVTSQHSDMLFDTVGRRTHAHGLALDKPALIATINSQQEPVLSQVTETRDSVLTSLETHLDRLVEGAKALKHELITALNDKSVVKDVAEDVRAQRIVVVEQSLDDAARELVTTTDSHARRQLRRSAHQHTQELERLYAEHQKSRNPTSSIAATKDLRHLLKLRDQRIARLATTMDTETWTELKADIDADSARIKELRSRQAQQTDTELDDLSAVERDIRTQMGGVSELRKEIATLKGMEKDDMTGREWKSHRNRIDRRVRLLIDRRLQLQTAIDTFQAFRSSDVSTSRHPDADVSIEAWPIGQSPETAWKTHYLDKGSHYWQKRRSHEMSRTICELIKVGLEAKDDFIVDLGLDESHPLHVSNLSLKNVEAEIEVQKDLILQMQRRAEDRKAALEIEKPSFPKYDRQGRDVPVAKLIGTDRLLSNALCELFANSQDSWHTLRQVCEYLANSKAPPTIQTFNILLVNLPRIGLQNLNVRIFGSILKCGLHPNEVTMEAALETASSMKQVRFFTSMADNMDAINGQGYLNLDAQTYDLVREDPRVLTDQFWERKTVLSDPYTSDLRSDADLAEHDLTKNSKRLLRMPLSQELYEALIVGYYGIGKVKRAKRLILRMEASGFKQNIRMLNAALRRHILDPHRGYIFKSLDDFLSGLYPGSHAELTEAVYLYFQILNTLWTSYQKEVPRASQRKASVVEDFKLRFRDLNAFGVEKGLISIALTPRHFKPFSPREFGNLDAQMELINRLSKPVLHLKFDADDVRDVTAPVSQMLWLDLQPLSLQEFVDERLAIVHQQYLERHGPLPLFDGHHAHGLEGPLAVAAEHRAIMRRRERQIRRWRRRKAISIDPGRVIKLVGPYAGRYATFRRRTSLSGRSSSGRHLSIRKSLRGFSPLPKTTKDEPPVLETPVATSISDHHETHKEIPLSNTEQDHSSTTYDALRGKKYAADFSLVPGRCVARASIEFR